MRTNKLFPLGGAALGAGLLVTAACTTGAEPAAAPGAGAAPSVVVQAGQLQPAPAQAAPSGWETEWSRKLGIKLLATYDSSGPAAWNPAEHPLVYLASEGPGYAGLESASVKLPGFAMIDASTRRPIAAPKYDLNYEAYFEPHGTGVSSDGRWIYVPTGTGAGFADVGVGRLLIIDARTFKLNKVLATPGNPHHIRTFRNAEGKELVQVEDFRDSLFYVLDPRDDNRVVGGIGPADLLGNGYLGFVDPSGKYFLVSVRTPFNGEPFESNGGVAVVDTKSWKVLRHIGIPDSSPIYVVYSADGKYAYVSGGHESIVAKIKMEGPPALWKVEATARAGTEGPYGLVLSWDEKQLWAIGKGEGSHNRGITVGLVDPVKMGRPIDTFYTGCRRADHAVLHPDPELNEMWLSCNSSFETVVFNLARMEVTARIPQPNGGSTHGGAFVRYNPDFSGQVVADTGGLHGPAKLAQLALLGLQPQQAQAAAR